MKKAKTKTEIAYDYLLSAFISRQYAAEEHLNISQIASECNVSEIPVREALRQLEGDGYVRISPNQGAFAIGIDRNEVSQLIQVKGVLEGFASRLALDYLTKADIQELNRLNDEMRVAMEKLDRENYSRLNMRFHQAIELKCGNDVLLKNLGNLWKRWMITRQVFNSDMRMKESFQEHIEIIRLIEIRDYETIESYVRNHKFRSVTYLLMNPGC
jgi:DNA-binding GntR family transcriptional regulator